MSLFRFSFAGLFSRLNSFRGTRAANIGQLVDIPEPRGYPSHLWGRKLLRLGPHPWRVPLLEKLDVNHVRIAADRAVLDVLLLRAGRAVQREDDLLAAGGADVRPLVRRPASPPAAPGPALFHRGNSNTYPM